MDLPDVVVEAQKVEKPKRGRGRRCLRRNLKKLQPQQEVEDVQVVEGGEGACALPALVSEDKRIPDLAVAEDVGVIIPEISTTSKKCTSRVTPSQNPAIQGEKFFS